MHVLLTSVFAIVGTSLAFPQNGFGSSGQCPTGCANVVVTENDNPDPHQAYFFQQMTDNHQCGSNGGCEISRSETEGHGVSVHADISGDGWISAGFEVSEYEESGEVQTCYGDPGDTICVFWRSAETMYTVNTQSQTCCRLNDDLSATVITSPNKNELGSGSICGRNDQCHSKGHSYWNNMERQNGGVTVSGGPQEWPFGNDFAGIVPDLDEVPPVPASS